MTETTQPQVAWAHVAHALGMVGLLGLLNQSGITPEIMTANNWWTPFLVANAGILLANLSVSVLLRRPDASAEVLAEGRREDLTDSRAIAVEQLRNLEAERGKLSDEAYNKERATLVAIGAEASRQLAEGSSTSNTKSDTVEDPTNAPTGEPVADLIGRLRSEQLADPAAFEKAMEKLNLTKAAPAPMLTGEWRGALVMALLGGMVFFLLQDADNGSRARAPGAGMTGGDSIGMSEAAPGAPAQAAPSPMSDPAALELLKQLEADPNNLEALNELTERALGTQDMSTAMQMNGRALQVAPEDITARTYQHVLRAFIGRKDDALTGLAALLEEAPNAHRTLVYYGLLLLRDDPAKAAEIFERAIAIEDSPQLQRALSEARAAATGAPPPAPAPPAPAQAAEVLVKGTINLAPGADGSAASVLFVSLKPGPGMPPVAAVKLPPGPFPMTFEVTTANVLPMAARRPMPSEFLVGVRLDNDGNAFSKDGEPAAEFAGIAPGTVDLDVVLK